MEDSRWSTCTTTGRGVGFYFMNTESFEQMHLMKNCRRCHQYLISAVISQRGILRRQAYQRGAAGHRGPDVVKPSLA